MLKKIAAAAAALALTAAAQASTVVFSDPGTGEYATDVTLGTPAFSATGASGLLVFTLDGYNTLDGANSYEDDFTLNVNGTDVLSGTFNLGGGGSNDVFYAPGGTTIVGLDNSGAITGAGGHLTFTVPVTLQATGNVITWNYYSLPYPDADFQGIGDEGWGLSDVTVSSVPEPGSIALMLAGVGIVSGIARRRAARRA